MPNNLHSRISALAATFVDSLLEAVKSSSLHELVGSAEVARGEPWSHGRSIPAARPVPEPSKNAPGGRLARRSAEDIAKVLEVVVSLLGSRKNGLRAEQIRSELNLQAKELPRILKEGLSRKKLRAQGQKRATTYFAK